MTGGLINVHPGDGWSSNVEAAVGDAIQYWDGCSEAGQGFPTICIQCNSGAYPIIVNYVNGPSPVGRCGIHEPVFVGGLPAGSDITIYQYAAGYSCDPLSDALAHELGHVLGLADLTENANCFGSIMGGRSPGGTRSVTSDDCATASDAWATPAEEQAECSATCPVACVGVPPACPGGGGGSGVGCENLCSPLVLDLDGNGILTTTVEDGVEFDLSGDGRKEKVAWTRGGEDDAFLYFDFNRNGTIDGGRELLGEATILEGGRVAANGFEALAGHDRIDNGGDGDGVISPRDAVWGTLRLWIDRDHDGRMTHDENYVLAHRRVLELHLGYLALSAQHGYGADALGNRHTFQGTFTQRVRSRIVFRSMHDIYFQIADR